MFVFYMKQMCDAEQKNLEQEDLNITPHKEADYVTPKKKELFRKRKAQPEKWKRNANKKLRCAGAEYISTSGKKVPKRKVKPVDCSSCRYNVLQK